ncbi:MAG: hypothetical protein WCR42_13175 [bacterium]
MAIKNQYNENGFIAVHGGYPKLRSFQKAEIIYDETVYFLGYRVWGLGNS